MSGLSSQFTREDIETLIEATGDWEMVGNQEFHVMQMIRNAPMPPEDHEAHEAMQQIKEHYRKRERDIQASRIVRQEKAVFLKAKLMLVRKDIGINQLFDMSANTDPNSPMPVAKDLIVEADEQPVIDEIAPKKVKVKVTDDETQKRLALAEFFIKDLGVWDHYQKFLVEKTTETVGEKD